MEDFNNKQYLKGTNLAGMSTTRERVEDDYYATPYNATKLLLDIENDFQ